MAADFRQNLVSGMDEDYADIFAFEIVEVTGAGAEKVIYFSRRFCSTETSANHDEGQMPFSTLRVGANFGGFHLLHDVRAKRSRIADAFEREGMVGHPRNNVQIGGAATSDNDVIVRHARGMAFVGLMFDFVLCQIEVQDGFSATKDARQQLSERNDDVERAKR